MKILLMGPSLDQNGGMATVQLLILKCDLQLDIQHITTHEEGTIIHRWLVFNKSLYGLFKKLLLKEIDLAHLHLSERGSAARNVLICLILFIFRKPVYVHAHGAEFEDFFVHLPKLLQGFLGFVFRRCDGFIVLSRSWKNYYVSSLNLNPNRVHILSNPVELPSEFPSKKPSSLITLVFCGRIGLRKGAFDLIRSFASLPDTLREKARLIMVGDGDLEHGRFSAARHGLMDRVTFLGWVNSQSRDRVLKNSDIFVLPSYKEGFPMAILEAMAWGLPVISTPVGGIPEMITPQQNGLLVQPGDINGLSDALRLLIENEELRHTFGKAARLTAESFDLKAYGDRLTQIYLSCLIKTG
jgi:glycosyltransferase involved in cell wall biosynthesis